MTDYNHKITNGSTIRGEHLKLFRAKAIYKAAIVHPYAKDVHVMSMAKIMPLSKCA